MRVRIAAILAAGAVALGVAPAAQANFHLMSISEVATNPAGADSAFIELQMYSSGQNQTGGHSVTFYASDGTLATPVPLVNVASGANQRTILIGDTAVPGRDVTYDMLWETVGTYGPGGAACFDTVDCVSWGNFANVNAALPSLTGTPAFAIPPGQSLTRSIAPGCATLLEASDDTNNSVADFALATPTPRNNATPPTEVACGGGGGGGGTADTNPPETKIDKGPKKKSSKTKAKFKFSSNEAGSTFECKLDKGAFEVCTSKAKYKGLDPGKHKFRVFATDTAGNPDPTPAKYRFKVTR